MVLVMAAELGAGVVVAVFKDDVSFMHYFALFSSVFVLHCLHFPLFFQ
jgi:hypothetical protein